MLRKIRNILENEHFEGTPKHISHYESTNNIFTDYTKEIL